MFVVLTFGTPLTIQRNMNILIILSFPRVIKLSQSNLLEAAGATLLRMSLMIYRGKALIATITATFHAKRIDRTKDISA